MLRLGELCPTTFDVFKRGPKYGGGDQLLLKTKKMLFFSSKLKTQYNIFFFLT